VRNNAGQQVNLVLDFSDVSRQSLAGKPERIPQSSSQSIAVRSKCVKRNAAGKNVASSAMIDFAERFNGSLALALARLLQRFGIARIIDLPSACIRENTEIEEFFIKAIHLCERFVGIPFFSSSGNLFLQFILFNRTRRG